MDRALQYVQKEMEEEENTYQVHMAMSAIRSLQLPEEQSHDPATMRTAIASGVAAMHLSSMT
jgi:hypothetical protein